MARTDLCLLCRDVRAPHKGEDECRMCVMIREYNFDRDNTDKRKDAIALIRERIKWYKEERLKCNTQVEVIDKRIDKTPEMYKANTLACRRAYASVAKDYTKKIGLLTSVISKIKNGETATTNQ